MTTVGIHPYMSASDPPTCVLDHHLRPSNSSLECHIRTDLQLRCTYWAYDAMGEITTAFSTMVFAGYNKFIWVFDLHCSGRDFGQHSTLEGKKEGRSGIISSIAFSPPPIQGCLLQDLIIRLLESTEKITWSSYMYCMDKKVGLLTSSFPRMAIIYTLEAERILTYFAGIHASPWKSFTSYTDQQNLLISGYCLTLSPSADILVRGDRIAWSMYMIFRRGNGHQASKLHRTL